jgi:hypothetical protein
MCQIIGKIRIKYVGTNIGENKVIRTTDFSIIENKVLFLKKKDGIVLKFMLQYTPLNIDSEITYRLEKLLDGEDTFSSNGLFSLYVQQKLFLRNKLVILGTINHIIYESEQIDNFYFMIKFEEENIIDNFICDYNFYNDNWILTDLIL